jgi:putative flippase GtrA
MPRERHRHRNDKPPERQGLQALYQRHRHFILYAFIGGFSASLDFVAYSLLEAQTDWNYQWINLLTVHLGIFCSFMLNAYFNFKVEDKWARRMMSFYIVGLLGLGISALSLELMIGQAGWNSFLAKAISIVFVVAFQFTCNKLITFAK